MKKFFTLAFLAVGMTVMAQHVTPLNIQIAELKFDSLRALYITEPDMYRASLMGVEKQLGENEKQLKAARAELKAEQSHVKTMGNALKEAGATAANLSKLYGKESDEIKDMQKSIEKQQKALAKQTALNEETRTSFSDLLDREQKELGYSLREVAERQREMANIQTQLQNMQTQLQVFDAEVQQKAQDLAQLEAVYKERVSLLKAEQKTAKAL